MLKKIKYIKYYSKILLNNLFITNETYSQHGEDILLDRLLPDGIKSFIDIGANDGVLFSNSYKFAKKGAYGLCVEPSINSFHKLRLNHLLHPKVKCVHGAVSDIEGIVYLQERGYESTLSEVSKNKSSNSYEVKSYKFDHILKQYPKFTCVDLLTVDVEGHEKEVFKGLTIEGFKAKIIILECDKTEISNLLATNSLQDYEGAFYNGVNIIMKHKEVRLSEILKLPQGFTKW